MAIRIPFIICRTLRVQMPIRWEMAESVILSNEAVMCMSTDGETYTSINRQVTLGTLDPITTTDVSGYSLTELGNS